MYFLSNFEFPLYAFRRNKTLTKATKQNKTKVGIQKAAVHYLPIWDHLRYDFARTMRSKYNEKILPVIHASAHSTNTY